MGKLMNRIRCRMGHHQWHPIRVQGQDARECSVCHERNFDQPGAADLARKIKFSDLGGPGGGGGF
jgi:hypothetical protein